MKILRCCVWGDIQVSSIALKIIDTPEFQRLHYIKQCGLLYKVFPTTKHSRFEHSIGVYHCTNLLLASLEKNSVEPLHVDQHTKELISIAGLCHDLGHGPFSHLYDLHLENNDISLQISKTHEERSCDIFRRIVDKYELKNTFFSESDVQFICDAISNPSNTNWYNTIINNPFSSFDTDKCDYLLRDSMMVGFPINFDIHRIFNNVILHRNEIHFCDKIKIEMEKLFLMREDLHKNIYRHPVVEKFQDYLLENLQQMPQSYDMDTFLSLSDESFLNIVLPPLESKRILFETRMWETFSNKKQIEYNDNQKIIAMKNLKWYSRKEIYQNT